MPTIKTGNLAHDNACAAAEITRQAAVAGTPTQAQVTAADVAFYRTCRASAIANNNGVQAAEFSAALKALNVGVA